MWGGHGDGRGSLRTSEDTQGSPPAYLHLEPGVLGAVADVAGRDKIDTCRVKRSTPEPAGGTLSQRRGGGGAVHDPSPAPPRPQLTCTDAGAVHRRDHRLRALQEKRMSVRGWETVPPTFSALSIHPSVRLTFSSTEKVSW